MGVTSGRLDLEDALLDGKERDIERSSSEIEDENVLLADALLVETVGDSSGGGLVDDAEHIHARDDSGVLGGLALRVVEVGGDGDDCDRESTSGTCSAGAGRKEGRTGVGNGGSEVGLGGLLHLEDRKSVV